MALIQNDILTVITAKVKCKQLWLHRASNMDAEYDMAVAVHTGDEREMQSLYRRVRHQPCLHPSFKPGDPWLTSAVSQTGV